MSKQLVVKFSDGSKWGIPAEYIARKRAEYYALHDIGGSLTPENTEDYNRIVTEEIGYALNDDYEITDWASNNMDWSDVVDLARRISEPKAIDMQKEWSNAEKKVKGE